MPSSSIQAFAAVITGDIISSRSLVDRAELPKVLHEVFARFSKEKTVLRPFEIYRGDSFQGVVQPMHALRMATIIRARLRCMVGGPLDDLTDARIAIGIGGITYMGNKVVESDGKAFHLSGQTLDAMALGRTTMRLVIEASEPQLQYGLEGVAHALDNIIGKWRHTSAQVMYYALVEQGMNQVEKAGALGITQSAVSQRLRTAQEKDVRQWLERYEKLITLHHPE